MFRTLEFESTISESFVTNLINEFWENENMKNSVNEAAHAIVVLFKRHNEHNYNSVIFSNENEATVFAVCQRTNIMIHEFDKNVHI